MADGLPVLLAPLLPAIALLLGRLGVLEPRQALWAGVMVALLQLIAIGVLVGVASEQRANTWRYAVVSAMFGLGVVLLLVALGH